MSKKSHSASGWAKSTLPMVELEQSTLPEVKPPVEGEVGDKPSRRRNTLDPLTQAIGEDGYFLNMRFEWLHIIFEGIRYPLEVTRYYKNKRIAIDVCSSDKDPENSKTKEKLCKENDIRYFILKDMADVDKILKSIGSVH